MKEINDFLFFLKKNLENYQKFDTWKHLEVLTSECAMTIIKNDPNYYGWTVEYDENAQKFPDVIITTSYGKFGIEVKSSKSKNWETLGGSINESTKVPGLDEIFILFGKNVNNQVNIKIKEFSKCVKSVAVTHSPRYLIDMNLKDGTDIFTKLNTSYEEVCASTTPFDIFKNYFKDKASKSNTKFWFLSDDENERNSENYQELEWKFLNRLTSEEKIELISEAIILYPYDLFGFKNTIYDNFNLFFLGRNIISNSMRDNFTAGGIFYVCGEKVPKKYSLLVDDNYLDVIHKLLSNNIPTIEMKRVYETEDIQKIRDTWFSEIARALELRIGSVPVRECILNALKKKV